jgi:hypothetical protein
MKTLAELKEMSFIPHHDCSLCGSMVGWVVSKDELKPYFDPSCDCGSSGGHYDTWEDVFKWYNTVFEKETEEAVQAAWNKEAMALNNEKQTTQYIRSELEDFRQDVNNRLDMLLYRIENFAEKDRVDFIRQRLENIEDRFSSFANCKPVREMLENHKSNWIADSKGGEPNCRRG